MYNTNPNPTSIDNQLASISISEPEQENLAEELRHDNEEPSSSKIEEIMEEPSSPSSSRYVGTSSSSSSCAIHDIVDKYNSVDGVLESNVQRLPGKRHGYEDDASISWRRRKKHFFILSHSGKPIYSRYGDEHKLAGFSATLQAIISFVESGGDRVNLVRAGKHQVVFLVKGPIYLVCISCTEESDMSLRAQLELLYDQMILILTRSVNRCFEKNPKFDLTPLLGGTDVVFSSLIHSFSWNPATFLHAYTCLPLAYATRQSAGAILQDIADSGILVAILMCKHKVISLVGAQKASLHPDDILLLSNFVMSSESFRTSESFSPICLPRFNPMAFLYAYVHYLDVDTYLILLTTSSDAFYHLKDCRIRVENELLKSNVLGEVQRSMVDGGMRIEYLPDDHGPRSGAVSPHLGEHGNATHSSERFDEAFLGVGGPGGLWHFVYRSIYLDQYVSSEFSPPINSRQQQKRLCRAYQKIYASMHDKEIGPNKTQFRRGDNYVLLCWVTPDFELYAVFDPLADKVDCSRQNSIASVCRDIFMNSLKCFDEFGVESNWFKCIIQDNCKKDMIRSSDWMLSTRDRVLIDNLPRAQILIKVVIEHAELRKHYDNLHASKAFLRFSKGCIQSHRMLLSYTRIRFSG